MKKLLSLLLLFTATMMGWSSAYAQTDEEPKATADTLAYEAALAAIQDGAAYRIKTDVGGTTYYLTVDGTLTDQTTTAGVFKFKMVAGEAWESGFQIDGGGTRFTNPNGTYSSAFTLGKITSTTNERTNWEAQVFFLKDGKYAVRGTNSTGGGTEGSWAFVADAFWTVNEGDEGPLAEYSLTVNYIWELELVYDVDGVAALEEAASLIPTWIPSIQTAAGLVKDASQYSSNAVQTTEGAIANLLDGEYSTYFHSSYTNAPAADHYLQAQLTEPTQKFRFYYKKRHNNNNNRPTEIVISASNDGTSFDAIRIINEGLPTSETVLDYLSDEIDLGAEYKYVRFTITATNNNGQANGHVFFTFSEFYMLPSNTATLTDAYDLIKANTRTYMLDVDKITSVNTALKEDFLTIKVTYVLQEDDGTPVDRKEFIQKAYSDIVVPAEFTKLFLYSYDVSGTIEDTDCTITITRKEKPGVIYDLGDLSNEKSYYIGCKRGAFLSYEGNMISTALKSAADKEPTKFAIINFESNYYLYSVEDNKFVLNTGALTDNFLTESHGDEESIVMTPKDEPYFFWSFNAKDKNINTNGNEPLGYVINNYSAPDDGNQYFMIEADDFDPTEPLTILESYFYPDYTVTFVVNDEAGNELFVSDPLPIKSGSKITSLPSDYRRQYYTYNEVDVTIDEQDSHVEFTATWNGPFEISADYASAHWYDMAMRGTWYVTTDYQDGDGAYQTQNANTLGLVEDSYQWAFIGNGYEGFKIINKAEGNGMSLGWTDANQVDKGIPTVMPDGEGGYLWNVVPSTATTVPAGSFCLNVPGTTLYLNQYGGTGGSVKFWNSANNIADAGSAFTVFDVPDNFSSYVIEEIAPVVEATGYFTLTDDAKDFIGYDESMKTECSFDDYKDMKDNLEIVMSDISNFILPESGYYILKNKYYGTYMGIDPSDGNMYGNYSSAKEAKHVVELIKESGDSYSISLMGKFAPEVVEQSQPVKAGLEDEAGIYTLTIPVIGYGVFQADISNDYSCLHCRAAGDLVGWEPNSPASQWEAIEATEIEIVIGSDGFTTAYLPFDVEEPETEDDIEFPDPVGVWTFDDGTVDGEGTATMTATDGVTFADGKVTVPVGDKLEMATNLAAAALGTYTLMMDVKVPNEDNSNFTALFQNDLKQASDASLFVNYDKNYANRRVGLGTGLGYGGNIELDTWYRIVFVNQNNAPTLYVNGERVTGPTATSYPANFQLTTGAIFFQDNDGEENEVVADEIRFWDVALSAEQIAELGVYGGQAAVVTIPEAKGYWKFDNASRPLEGTGVATISAAKKASISQAGIKTIDGGLLIPKGSSLLMDANLGVSELTTYSILYDVCADDASTYIPLLQNNLRNTKDGSLFINKHTVGLNSGNLGYHGVINDGEWYRILFVVENNYATLYVNGERIGASTTSVEQHWKLSTGALFFADEDGEENAIKVSELGFWDVALTPTQVEKLGVAGSDPDGDSDMKIYTGKISDVFLAMTELTGGIPARTGVVLKGNPGKYNLAITEGLAPVANNDLKGTLEPIDATDLYLLNKPEGEHIGFYKASAGTIAAGKAYLDVDSELNGYILLFEGDNPDAIKGIEATEQAGFTAGYSIFNIAGQRLQKMQKGVNIVNGKKILK